MKKILLIDDDMFKKVLKMMLSPMGYDIHLANNGIEGLQAVDKMGDEIVLIFLDMMMPGMDGLKFLNVLRNEKKSDIPVIAMSSVTDPKIIQKVHDAGILEYCVKPVRAKEIKAKVKSILGD